MESIHMIDNASLRRGGADLGYTLMIEIFTWSRSFCAHFALILRSFYLDWIYQTTHDN